MIIIVLNFSRYQNEFGFTLSDRKILVDDIRVRGIGKSLVKPECHIDSSLDAPAIDMVRFKITEHCSTFILFYCGIFLLPFVS